MKRIALYSVITAGIAIAGSSCTKVLDKYPQTQTVRSDSASAISATDAENIILGLYQDYKSQVEFNVLDRITNGDVLSDNAYAGGDNTANITLDNFTFNSLNGNLNRDYADAYVLIGKANIAIQDVGRSTDPSLVAARKAEIVGDAKFLRAFTYFDLVRLFGRVPLKLKPSNNSSADSLLASSLVAQSSVDSIYQQILQDLWDAKASVPRIGAYSSKYTITQGPVFATLAKVYATMPTPNWDSVGYYCDQLIPNYSLLTDYTFLWDNAHKNSSEAIWEFTYDGWNEGDKIGNWAPSQFWALENRNGVPTMVSGGWKRFETPSNDLVSLFRADGDSVRLHASITFLDSTNTFTDTYWSTAHYPYATKYNDPNNGINDFYLYRLPDILLLKAEQLVKKGDLNGAMALVTQVRARVKLGPKTAASPDQAEQIIANERRQEFAFEGHRWFDLLRTGKAIQTMNAVKDGKGNILYNVADYRVIMPIPQQQIDLNPKLVQTDNY